MQPIYFENSLFSGGIRSAKSWIFFSRLSCTWSITSKGFCTYLVFSWLHSSYSKSSYSPKFVFDSTVDSIALPAMLSTFSTFTLLPAMNAQSNYNNTGVVSTGLLDHVLVIGTVMLNWLLLAYIIMQQWLWTIPW